MAFYTRFMPGAAARQPARSEAVEQAANWQPPQSFFSPHFD